MACSHRETYYSRWSCVEGIVYRSTVKNRCIRMWVSGSSIISSALRRIIVVWRQHRHLWGKAEFWRYTAAYLWSGFIIIFFVLLRTNRIKVEGTRRYMTRYVKRRLSSSFLLPLDTLLSAMWISCTDQGVPFSCIGSPWGCAGDTRSMHTRLHPQVILCRMVDLPMRTIELLLYDWSAGCFLDWLIASLLSPPFMFFSSIRGTAIVTL